MNHAKIRRAGLTLMELIVVLTILVALSAIVVPMLPNLLTKAHDSTTVTNIPEVDKAIMGYLTLNLKYPDQFDSIMTSSGAVYSKTIFSSATFTPSTGSGTRNVFTPSTIASDLEAQSLTFGGIRNLMVMKSNPTNATFDAYVNNGIGTGATVAVQNSTPVLQIDDDYILQKLNVSQKANARYLLFALGPKCTLVGDTNFGVFDAPVCFGEHDIEQPSVSYQRMLLVFRVYSDGTRTEYINASHPDSTGLGTAAMHLQEYYGN